jgi:hypothetical protein
MCAVKLDNTTAAQRAAGIRDQVESAQPYAIRLGDGIEVWIDDEGPYRSERNDMLTSMVHQAYPQWSEPIHGRGLFLGIDPTDGSPASLTIEQQIAVVTAWRQVSVEPTPVAVTAH